ncbi:MAG TPA: YigZ family protein [Trueperaceae bacterium]|nr:YigZ family protein [Trueperaceae bacterium]
MAGERLTAAREVEHEDVVEGSRFIARVRPVSSVEAAEALVDEARRDHPEATHHCWAYKLGEVMRFSDDGEPGGTAGRPMLEVMLKRGLDGCAAVVVRYFGGRKLGAGGLVRAYGGAVARALDAAGVRRLTTYHRLRVRAPFASAASVLRELHGAVADFDERGLVTEVAVPATAVEGLRTRLAELTRGEAEVEQVGVEEGPAA